MSYSHKSVTFNHLPEVVKVTILDCLQANNFKEAKSVYDNAVKKQKNAGHKIDFYLSNKDNH